MRTTLLFLCVPALGLALSAQSLGTPTYTREQAEKGKRVYDEGCASCHGANLDDGQFAPPLTGSEFRQKWGGRSMEALFTYTSTRMPPASPGGLSAAEYASMVALMLERSGVGPGSRELPSDADALSAMLMPGALPGPGGGLAAGISLPPWPAKPNPLARISPVTDAMLLSPPDGAWLNWRRTYDAHGFSPLTQITTANVARLGVAWTWALPNGPNEATPLVHDGVLFVQSYGDKVQALDAATGDLLWQYARRLPRGARTTWKRNMSIYGDRLYAPTSDAHIVALDFKTGALAWETAVGDASSGFGITGGPLLARGVVMVGTNGSAPGGNVIVGLDANTGVERWRWHAVAQPGEPGGDTWNLLSRDARSGGAVWVAGTYDPALNLAFFGPAPTYDTGPLRNLAAGARSNDALYTNATVALNPETGKLAWYFQHRANDQWDLDWAFERTVVDLPAGNGTRRVLVTGGKEMIFDLLEAGSGTYVSSFDLGLQNIVTAIDPATGRKTINQSLVPGDGERKFVCPHAGGGRAWMPTSYNAATRRLYVPMVESCMDLVPVGPGGRGSLSTGVRWFLRPRPDSDGKYGRLQAIDVQTRQTVWAERQRAPQTTGVLATAGGVVFAGSLDRVFAASDAATGARLWSARLNDVPNGAPIAYMVTGKQYVALTVGNGGPQTGTYPNLVPEIRNPSEPSAALWVFELK